MSKNFSIREALRFGWSITRTNFWFLAGVLVVILISFLPNYILDFFNLEATTINFGLSLIISSITWILQMIIGIGITKIFLGFIDNKEVKISDLFVHYRFFWKYAGAWILYIFSSTGVFFVVYSTSLVFAIVSSGIHGGLVGPVIGIIDMLLGLLGILGLIILVFFGIRLMFFNYFIVDKGLGPIMAIKASFQTTQDVFWLLFGFLIVIGLINILGALVFLVGLFVTIPTTLLAITFVYRKLLDQTKLDLKKQ